MHTIQSRAKAENPSSKDVIYAGPGHARRSTTVESRHICTSVFVRNPFHDGH